MLPAASALLRFEMTAKAVRKWSPCTRITRRNAGEWGDEGGRGVIEKISSLVCHLASRLQYCFQRKGGCLLSDR